MSASPRRAPPAASPLPIDPASAPSTPHRTSGTSGYARPAGCPPSNAPTRYGAHAKHDARHEGAEAGDAVAAGEERGRQAREREREKDQRVVREPMAEGGERDEEERGGQEDVREVRPWPVDRELVGIREEGRARQEALLDEPEVVIELEVVALDAVDQLTTGRGHRGVGQRMAEVAHEGRREDDAQEQVQQEEADRGAAPEAREASAPRGRFGRHRRAACPAPATRSGRRRARGGPGRGASARADRAGAR